MSRRLSGIKQTELQDIEVTIICLTYNHSSYIATCLDSLLNQKTSFRYKILVHDDCSDDGTLDIVKDYQIQFPQLVEVIEEEQNCFRQGIWVRPIIFRHVSGQYIALCEGDDYWTDEHKLQKQYDYIQNHSECSLIVHAADVFDDRLKSYVEPLAPSALERNYSTSEIISSRGWLWATNSMFFKAEYYVYPEEFRNWGVGDFPLSIYLSMMGAVHYLPEKMSVYRKYAKGSWSSSNARSLRVRTASLRSRASGLKKLDAFSNQRFHEEILKVVSDWECEADALDGNVGSLLGTHRYEFKHLGWKRKIRFTAKCIHSALRNRLRRSL